MEAKRHPVNLNQYRKVNGKWQFVAVASNAQGKLNCGHCEDEYTVYGSLQRRAEETKPEGVAG
jgi:hypothetical protein